ncbi:MAG TPA: ABC transporter permease subunit [Acidobacteriota bacterium]|nr:ABC transporter permease subunit [Acidobacteriota bacterium]
MIWDVVRKEIRTNISTPKVFITYIVCTVLILSALVTGAVTYTQMVEDARQQTAAEKDRLKNVFNYQQDFLVAGQNVYRVPSALSVLVSGVEGDSARRGNVNTMAGATFDVSKFNSTPVLAVFGLLDLDFIVKIILSLFAILFTFDAVSGEKELGTLKLNFSNPMKRSSFIIGKLIGNFVLLIIPFVIPLIMGLLILEFFFPAVQLNGEDWVRLGLIFLAFMLYLLVFYSLGMMVSSLTKRSSVSFLVLLMLWVFFISIVPRGAVLVAQWFHEVPALEEVKKDFARGIGPNTGELMKKLRTKVQELQQQLISTRPRKPVVVTDEYRERMRAWEQQRDQASQEFQSWLAEQYQEFTQKIQQEGMKKVEEMNKKQNVQTQLAVNISRYTSPAAALTFSIQRLAKSGVYSSDDIFQEQVRGTVATFSKNATDVVKQHPEYLNQGFGGGQPIDVSDQYIDTTSFKHESLDVSIASSLVDLAVLVLLSVVFIAVAFLAFIRYDVR